MSVAAITDIDRLREALQTAIELEHATIPPYLCALYSIRAGRNIDAAAVIESVVMEEMLHMVLAANVLNAIEGAPVIDRPDFIPRYPATLPHSDGRVIVSLRRFSPDAVEDLPAHRAPGTAERPARWLTATTPSASSTPPSSRALQVLAGEGDIFTGDPGLQVAGNGRVYGMAGEAIAVHDLESALAALAIIVDQGEGIDHTIHDGDAPLGERAMLAHYYRFDEIARRRRYRPSDTPRTGPTGPPLPVDFDAVWPMRPDPRADDLPPGSEVRAMTDELNAIYSDLLRLLHRGLNGEPDQLGRGGGPDVGHPLEGRGAHAGAGR